MYTHKCYIFDFCTIVPKIIADDLISILRKYAIKECRFNISGHECVRLFMDGDVIGSVVVRHGYVIGTNIKIRKLRFRSDIPEEVIRRKIGNEKAHSQNYEKLVKLILAKINNELKMLKTIDESNKHKNISNAYKRIRKIFGKYFKHIKETIESTRDYETIAMFEMLKRGEYMSVRIMYDKVENKKRGIIKLIPVLCIEVPGAQVRGTIHIPKHAVQNIDDRLLGLLSLLEEKSEKEMEMECPGTCEISIEEVKEVEHE